jgi:four helix bundle protein
MKSTDDKKYDLEERTFVFAKNVIEYVRNLPKGIAYSEIGKQLVRSAGSVGANYIEANESLSKKDFLMRIKICRKEAKESTYWLKLSSPTKTQETHKMELMRESEEIMKICSAIMRKVHV